MKGRSGGDDVIYLSLIALITFCPCFIPTPPFQPTRLIDISGTEMAIIVRDKII